MGRPRTPDEHMETVHILVVTSSSDDVAVLRGLLQTDPDSQVHYRVDESNDYMGSLKDLVRNRHDVYILDQKLGGTTGLDLLQRANAGGCTTPVILLTTLSDDEMEWAVDDVGAAGFLNKHLDMHERVVKHAIRNAIYNVKQLKEAQDRLTRVQQLLADIGKRMERR